MPLIPAIKLANADNSDSTTKYRESIPVIRKCLDEPIGVRVESKRSASARKMSKVRLSLKFLVHRVSALKCYLIYSFLHVQWLSTQQW